MKKTLALVPALLLVGLKLYAQDDYDSSEDHISIKDTLIMAAVGGGLLLLGKLISEVKAVSGLGNIVMAIGAFLASLGVFTIGIVILEAAVSLALKIAVIVGVIALGIWIVTGIMEMLKGKKTN